MNKFDGATLLGERAMLSGYRVPGLVSAGGGCRLYRSRTGLIALNLARPGDRELLPALFETESTACCTDATLAALIAASDAQRLVARGRILGLAIAAERQSAPLNPACKLLTLALPVSPSRAPAPRVLDLSALWAGPLAAHLLWLAGAEVIKVESRGRPGALGVGEADFFALLNQGKASLEMDLRQTDDRSALLSLIAGSDIVIEAARPRALLQLGIDADTIVGATPGLTWLTITAHGAQGEAANWVGFGDDCGVAAGLTAALRGVTGCPGFVGDAIADPLTGILAAGIAWDGWSSGKGGRFGLTMSGVVAEAIAEARSQDSIGFDRSLVQWAAAKGSPFGFVKRRAIGPVSPQDADMGAHRSSC
ncbi:MAG: CoA transferase [Sphingomicrobium sp.]